MCGSFFGGGVPKSPKVPAMPAPVSPQVESQKDPSGQSVGAREAERRRLAAKYGIQSTNATGAGGVRSMATTVGKKLLGS